MSSKCLEDEILSVAFNQDSTSVSVGSRKGYRLYSLSTVDAIQKIHESELTEVCVVERLFSSSLITVVSQSSARKLRVCHFQKGTEICSHSYSNTVLNVRLNRLRLIVCLEESLYVHNIRDMKVLHTIRDTPPNHLGLCELTASDVSYVAYPGSSQIGEVQVFDASNLQALTSIFAHDSPLAALKFNMDGNQLATASEKGTVIRVFAIPSGDRLFEFRRGVKRCVTIYSLAFSQDSLFLCASSNTETIHVFKLEHHKDGTGQPYSSDVCQGNASPVEGGPGSASQGGGWMDYVSKTAANYLPSQVSEMLTQDRAFAFAHLPHAGLKTTVALSVIEKVTRLLVASTDGYLYIFNCDTHLGGECHLVKRHKLFGSAEQPERQGLGDGGPKAISVKSTTNPGSGGVTGATVSSGAQASYAAATKDESKDTQNAPESHLQREIERSHHATAALKLDDSAEFPPMSHLPD